MIKTKVDAIVETPHVGSTEYTLKDFKNNLDIRWCPGCGDYAILAQMQKTMASLNIPRENIAIISGIGCSSRFPYYMNLYGMHGIHGRALAIASGLKIARSDLSVWVATGDGDCMSIGGNHFIHAARRNVDLNVCMFNNEIYSLTKGQYSPTSRVGQITKSSPLGVLDDPFNTSDLAIGAGSTFVARVLDKDQKDMQYAMKRAYDHKGFSFVEVYSNCVIFNDGCFTPYTDKHSKPENVIYVEHGKPLVFGAEKDKGIKLDGYNPVVVNLNEGNSIDDLLVYDEKDRRLASIISSMTFDETTPRPMGILLDVDDRASYNDKVDEQIAYERKTKGVGSLFDLMKGQHFWGSY